MENMMDNFLYTIAVSVVPAVISAFVTVQLSLTRFRFERRWEKRAKTYEDIMEALHHAKAFSAAYLGADYKGREISDDVAESVRARSKAAAQEIEKAADIGAYLLSKEALDRLKRYQDEEDAAGDANHWLEYLDNDWTAASSCLSDFIAIAKRDLKVDGWWSDLRPPLHLFRKRTPTPSTAVSPAGKAPSSE